MKFDKNKFFILYPNPIVAAKIVGSMASSSWWYENRQIYHMAYIQNSSMMSPTSSLREHWQFWYPSIQICMNDCHRDPKTRQYHLTGSGGTLEILNLIQRPIHSSWEIIRHSTKSQVKVTPIINWKNNTVKWNVWVNFPYSNGTTFILVHISNPFFSS